jgi:cell division protein FtsQ
MTTYAPANPHARQSAPPRKRASPTGAPTKSPTTKRPTTKSPTIKRPTTKSPTTKRPTTGQPGPIDPRLRDRRVAVLRAQGRHRLRRLGLVVTVLAIAAVAVGVVFSPLLDVDRIAVTGITGARVDEVRAATGVERGEPLLLVDTGSVEARVEALPWVAQARAARHFPGSLTVAVTTRVPTAWVLAVDGSVRLVDDRGVVVGTATAAPPSLPQLPSASTPGAGPPAAAARVAASLTPTLRANVGIVAVVKGQAVLYLSTGTEIRLGAPRDVTAKARAAEAVLASLSGANPVYVDVRVPSAPVTG